jgi:hypothetical protein
MDISTWPCQDPSTHHLIYISYVTPSTHPHDIPARDCVKPEQTQNAPVNPTFLHANKLATLYAPIIDGPPRLAMLSGVDESILGYVLLYASILELIPGSQRQSHQRLFTIVNPLFSPCLCVHLTVHAQPVDGADKRTLESVNPDEKRTVGEGPHFFLTSHPDIS